jgi:hypothetical protein
MTTETFELKPNAAPNPSLEESAAKMGIDVTKIDPTATEQSAEVNLKPEAKVRPDHIPEKFWDAAKGEMNTDALLKSYTELEKKGAKPDEKPTDEKPPEKTEAEKAAEDAAAKSGLNLDDLSKSFWENNASLNDDQYAALEKGGYPRHIVDQFIEGQKLIIETQQTKVYNETGGPEGYTSMITWAANNLDATEIAAYNEAINKPDMSAVLLAVRGLTARYRAEADVEPVRVTGGSVGRGGGEVYESAQQMKDAMADPRYKKDPAYRAKVEAAVARSSAF